jgi:hypothetical protein
MLHNVDYLKLVKRDPDPSERMCLNEHEPQNPSSILGAQISYLPSRSMDYLHTKGRNTAVHF